ncbi:MAG: hypothetical protein J5714_02855 [Alphaproteobacteria bacterium]|nr:hypothetical protein [Alphaproteobacteria bacterium]
MFKGWKFLTSFCVMFATLCGGAYGAASVRGGATGRAGSLRTLGGGTSATVKTNANQPAPSVAVTGDASVADSPRMVTGISTGRTKLNLASTTGTSGGQNLSELRQAIEQLRNDYDALDERYNTLLGDVSNVSDTAQNANLTAESNANTLVVVRSDLNDAQSDLAVLKAAGGFDEARVQQTVEGVLDARDYATQSQLAATDVVARGAVQLNDLSQKLDALNIADRDYVDTMVATGMSDTRVQGIVNDSLNNTMANYYTKKQVNDAINTAKDGMVDKDYVDYQVQTSIGDKASYTYVDQKVATGMNEAQVQGIIGNVLGGTLENYYDKGTVDSLVDAAVVDAKNGMVDKDYVDNQVRDMASKDWVNNKIADIEIGVDEYEIRNILAQGDYKTGTQVEGIVTDALNGALGNYYTRQQVNKAISDAKEGMVGMDQLNYQLSGLAPKSWVTTQIDSAVTDLDFGLNRDAVKAVVEEYGYKNENDVRGIITGYGYVKETDIPDLVNQWAPGAEIQYADGKLYFVDKDGNDRVVDIRGLDGQDGAQVELQKNGDVIQWRYASGNDQSWHNLVNLSDLRGADGKSVEFSVQPYGQIKEALGYTKEGESNWQFLYNLDDINGTDGCGVRATQVPVDGGILVKLLRDCAGQPGDGDLLTQFTILNGADGTVTDEQIIDAMMTSPEFIQLMQVKNKVNDSEKGLDATYNLARMTANAVDDDKTGLEATYELASNAWDKVKDLDTNVTTKDYVDSYVNGKIGELDYNPATYAKFASVGAKLGSIGNMTVKDYVDEKVRGITTEIMVDKGTDGFTYICKNGNTCANKPNYWDNEWERIDVDLTGYLKQETADNLYASFGTEVVARDAATAATNAQTTANNAWNKVKDLGDGVTVSDYVDERIGTMGFDMLTGDEYTVAKKIGLDDRQYGSMSVKEYVDKKVSDVNTSIQIGSYNNQTYICKHNDCKTPAGPYYPEDWALISVDLSGYLTRNDAEREFASIETESIAGAAQNAAASAQTTAATAQTTANNALGKLGNLGTKTVTEYVDEKVGSTGLSIRVETGTDGYTYICTAKESDCRDAPSSSSSYWSRINFNIPDEYLTATEGNELYALKTQIGTLGGSFTSVADKIGLNDYQYGNTSVKDYVDNKVSNISTSIQIETSNGTTYICKTGSGCPEYDLTNTTYWTPVAVNLGNLGTNPSTGQTYTVAQKIGLTDSANINKTVVGYVGEKIGDLGSYSTYYGQQPHSVLTYLQANYAPITSIGTLGKINASTDASSVAEKLGLEITNANNTVAGYITGRIGSTGTDTYGQPKSVVDFLSTTYAPLAKIGDLGAAYTGAPTYTVAEKIGLVDSNVNKTVKGYVDEKIGTLGDNYASVAAKLGEEITNTNKTVATYIADAVNAAGTSIVVRSSATDGNTYICTGSDCSATDPYGDSNWTKLNVNLSGINAILSGFGGENQPATVKGYISDKIGTLGKVIVDGDPVNAQSVAEKIGTEITSANKTVAGYVDTAINGLSSTYAAKFVEEKFGAMNSQSTVTDYVGSVLGDLGKKDNSTNAASVAEKLGTDITSYDGTVKDYIAYYVSENAASGGVVVKPGTDGNTYICTGTDCSSHENDPNNDSTNWTKLNVDLTAINTAITNLQTGKADKTEIGTLGKVNSSTDASSVAEKLGTEITSADNTVAGYITGKIGDLGKKDSSTNAASVAAKLGTDITSYDGTVKDYIAYYVSENAASGGVQVKTVGNDTYICSENCESDPPCQEGSESTCGWQKLQVNLTEYLKSSVAASTYVASAGLKLVRDGADIKLQQVSDGTVVKDYGVIAGVQDLMCQSYEMQEILGTDPRYIPGKVTYEMVCVTNGSN